MFSVRRTMFITLCHKRLMVPTALTYQADCNDNTFSKDRHFWQHVEIWTDTVQKTVRWETEVDVVPVRRERQWWQHSDITDSYDNTHLEVLWEKTDGGTTNFRGTDSDENKVRWNKFCWELVSWNRFCWEKTSAADNSVRRNTLKMGSLSNETSSEDSIFSDKFFW